jgi:hypothetical protein
MRFLTTALQTLNRYDLLMISKYIERYKLYRTFIRMVAVFTILPTLAYVSLAGAASDEALSSSKIDQLGPGS